MSSERPCDTVPKSRGRILVIDDEEPVRSLIEAVLSNHEVISLSNARDALERVRHGERFDLIISDVLMPTMTGLEFYHTLSEEFPELSQRILFLTGGAIDAQMDTLLNALPHKPIEKPFEVDRLRKTVDKFLNDHPTSSADQRQVSR